MSNVFAQALQQQVNGELARRLLSDWLWIVVGVVALGIGILLVALDGGVVANQPVGACEAVIATVVSDGKQVNLEPGYSPVTLAIPSNLSDAVNGLKADTRVWFATDEHGALASLQKAEDADAKATKPPESCDAKIVAPYSAATQQITLLPSFRPLSLDVPDALTTRAKAFAAGDQVWFSTDSAGKLSLLHVKEYTVGWMQAAGAVVLAFTASWTLLLIVTRGHPWAFVLGLDLRLSNSQTQAYFWFLVFVTVYLAELALRLCHTHYFGGISAPAELLALAGISASSFVGARVSNLVQSGRDGSGAVKGKGKLGRSRWQLLQDLFRNDDGAFDLGDFQMIALTVAAIAVYAVTSVYALTRLTCTSLVDLPPVDETLIGGTAASQGAYLLKKFASRLGN